MKKLSTLRVFALLSCVGVFTLNVLQAQVSITATGNYSQNFNSLQSTGGPHTWTNNSTIANWYSQMAGTESSTYAVSNGTTTTGNRQSLGATSNSERALGSVASNGTSHISYGVLFQNTSGSTITDVTVAYTGEQWRVNGNTTPQLLQFYYKVSATSFTALDPGSGSGWTAVSALNFTSPITSGTAILDGNAGANRTVFSATALSSISVPDGSYLMIKWDDLNDTGNDHVLAIDDVTVAWTVPPSGPSTSVQFVNTSSSVAETAGTTNLALAITDFDVTNATSVTISATGATGRITSFTSPVIFGANSGSNENCVVAIDNNLLCDGDQNVTFTITGISGGQGTPTIGANNTHTLTITDNDVCTSVQFVSTSSGVSEAAGTTNLALAITNFDVTNATSVTIAATGATGRIGIFTTPVIFPANDGSNQNCTVNIANNILCDGDQAVTFTITGISGGQGTAFIGANSTHTLTVQNDDVCTSVAFAGSTADVMEDDGSFDLQVNITGASASQATSVDVVLVAGDGTRVEGFTSQTVTFPANTSTPQTVTLTLTNDFVCNGIDNLEFELQNLTGGQGTPFIASPSSFILTITDDEFPVDPVALDATEVGAEEFTANWIGVPGGVNYFLDVYTMSTMVADDFTDGNFTANPAWQGSTGSYAVLTDATLPSGAATTDGSFLASNASVGQSALMVPSTEVAEWRFSWGSPSFSPSAVNHFGVILMSDASISDLGTSFNGYYLRIGVDVDPDRIELWRASGLTRTRVGNFTTPDFGAAALTNGLNVRVTRSNAGVFALFYEAGFTYATVPTTSAGTLTDNTHSTSSYFGLYTAFANAATSRRNYLDNVVLGGLVQFVPNFEDLLVMNVQEYEVTDLDPGTTYYYRVRSAGGCSTGDNSNAIEVTTLVPPATTVSFASASSAVGEAAGTTSLQLTVVDADPVNSTTVTITASGATGRISGFSTPVVIPGGESTASVSVDIANDILCNGDQDVVFTITQVTGGQGIPAIGAQSTHTLTVENDDTCTGLTFAAASATISEDAGTYAVVVNITEPSLSQATSVDVVLVSGDGSRIDGFTSQTVVFPTGSSAPQTALLTVSNNLTCDPTATLTFALQNATGGQNTPDIGANRTLTILDNEQVPSYLIAQQGFEEGVNDIWSITTNTASISTATGSGDTPGFARIRTGAPHHGSRTTLPQAPWNWVPWM
jgi:hypothetical protein